MRGLAVSFVLLGHVFAEIKAFGLGWIGLNLFFILSGFLITQRLYYHSQKDDGRYFRSFYIRRALRILPLYYAILIFYFFIFPLVYTNYDVYYLQLNKSQLWFWVFLSNWWMSIYGIPSAPDLFHFWSLAVEEQFYLCWPALFLLLKSGQHK